MVQCTHLRSSSSPSRRRHSRQRATCGLSAARRPSRDASSCAAPSSFRERAARSALQASMRAAWSPVPGVGVGHVVVEVALQGWAGGRAPRLDWASAANRHIQACTHGELEDGVAPPRACRVSSKHPDQWKELKHAAGKLLPRGALQAPSISSACWVCGPHPAVSPAVTPAASGPGTQLPSGSASQCTYGSGCANT